MNNRNRFAVEVSAAARANSTGKTGKTTKTGRTTKTGKSAETGKSAKARLSAKAGKSVETTDSGGAVRATKDVETTKAKKRDLATDSTGAIASARKTARRDERDAVEPSMITEPKKQGRNPVRDSFTMPEVDFALIAMLKDRTLSAKRMTRKSELLRAGVHALAAMPTADLIESLDKLEPVVIGRSKKR